MWYGNVVRISMLNRVIFRISIVNCNCAQLGSEKGKLCSIGLQPSISYHHRGQILY